MCSMRPVELRMSANSTVRRLRSPPLALSERSNCSEESEGVADKASGLLHWAQKRLPGRFWCPQAAHVCPSGAPHASQKAFAVLLPPPQCGQCITLPLARQKKVTGCLE